MPLQPSGRAASIAGVACGQGSLSNFIRLAPQRTLTGLNFLDDSSCSTANGTADGTTADPLLGPLADNGGPTLTRALLAGSPAINAATGTCPPTDQRGVAWPVGPACDVGADEASGKPTLTALDPASRLAGSGPFPLLVTGRGFLSGTAALGDGSVRPTTILNSTTLSVAISAAGVQTPKTATVTARYGEAADSVSNGLPFHVVSPTPTATPSPTPTEWRQRQLIPLMPVNQPTE
ncbi:MAG: choice-of-anchor Q domain-containing protein [Chloroflexota bacterium]|nr:choice-of-anchor Q domain-containing protein [Chloroflexota bacterium]